MIRQASDISQNVEQSGGICQTSGMRWAVRNQVVLAVTSQGYSGHQLRNQGWQLRLRMGSN